ncbi:MAG TPA: RNA polymerase sigma factor [Candidatus Didemnitutus sp.]|nr:RNA polymerase sigma factor [Candidatus Didemnitutus sp.]
MTGAEPIARAGLSGDRDAFGVLVEQHQSSVRHFLRRLTNGDAARADDLAQDTFVEAFKSFGCFQGRSSVSTWLLGIAHNLWRNDRRRQRPVALEPGHLAEVAPVSSTATSSDLRHDFEQALRHLTPAEQSVAHLFYQQGLTHEEIAAILGQPLGTVKTHLHRSREKLRTQLAPWSPKN